MAIRVSRIVYTWAAILGLGVVILMITLLALTVNKEVSQDQLMITKNSYTGKLDGPFEQGRYNLAVGDSMIMFGRTVQPLHLTVSCFSSDMLQVSLDLTVMFQYMREQLVPVLMRMYFDEDYFLPNFRAQIESSAWQTCSNFTAEDYYQRRQSAELALLNDLRISLSQESEPTVVQISQLQLTDIRFPEAYNKVISDKLQTQVQQTASLNNRQMQLTGATTALQTAKQQAAITLINGEQQANAILSQANATQQITVDQWKQRALSFLAVQTSLQLDEVGLVKYMQDDLLRLNPRSVVTV